MGDPLSSVVFLAGGLSMQLPPFTLQGDHCGCNFPPTHELPLQGYGSLPDHLSAPLPISMWLLLHILSCRNSAQLVFVILSNDYSIFSCSFVAMKGVDPRISYFTILTPPLFFWSPLIPNAPLHTCSVKIDFYSSADFLLSFFFPVL